MRRTLLVGIAASLAVLAVTIAPREARAGLFLGAELDAATQVSNATSGNGYGFVGILGYRIKLGPVFLQPEAQGSYMLFPQSSFTTHATRVTGGGRFGLSGLFQPALFAHMGIGWLGEGRNGRDFDAGLALGFKLIPYLRFGAQISYNVLQIPNDLAGQTTNFKWLGYGAHAAVEF